MIKGNDKDPKIWRSWRRLPPAVVMAVLLGACTSSSCGVAPAVPVSPVDEYYRSTRQPQNCVPHTASVESTAKALHKRHYLDWPPANVQWSAEMAEAERGWSPQQIKQNRDA